MNTRESEPSYEVAATLDSIDTMTGLLNRQAFDDELAHYAQQLPGQFCVGFMDLNDLKKVNDEQGHAAGDRLLQNASLVLQECLRSTPAEDRLQDVLGTGRANQTGRHGGDEFAFILPGIEGDDAADAIVSRLQASLVEANVSAAIGYAIHTGTEAVSETLRRADENMLGDKRAHKEKALQEKDWRNRLKIKLGNWLLESAGITDPGAR